MRAALLARVSTEGQAAEARHSLPAQLSALRLRCEREGWVVVREFVAPGETASTNDLARRPVLRELMEAAERREFDVVVFHESSRLARDEELAHWLINRMESFGIRLVNASKDVDYHDAEGRFLYSIDAGLDAYWSRKMSSHIKKGKRQAFEEGRSVGSLPFGYVRDEERQVVVVPVEAEAVRWAFAARLRGVGPSKLAEEFNRRGLSPRSRQGYSGFTTSSMQSLLENDFYAGFVRHRGERRPGIHEAVISEGLWSQVQSIRRRPSPAARREDGGLLVGLVSCSDCGGPVWSSSSGPRSFRKAFYREAAKLQLRECVSAGASWRCEEPDAQVEALVRALGLDEEWLASAAEAASVMREGADPAVERGRLEQERHRATNAYVAGALGEPQWRALLARIERDLSQLPSAPLTVMSGAMALRSFAEVWDGMVLGERREAVKAVLASVSLDMRGRRVLVEPREGYGELFAHRVGGVVTPPAGAGVSFYASPFYRVEDLIKGVA